MKRIRILLIMSILTLCVPVCAQRKWDGVVATAFAGGTGTQYDPYLITNAGEFAFMLEQTRKGNDFNGKCIKFRNDIVFNATIESGKTFSGVLDGNGYYVHGANFSPEGIFGTLNGTIKNLMISDTKYGRYGFVTIISSTGKLINCNFSGNLRCSDRYDYYSDRYGFARTNQGVIANCAIVGSTDFHSGYQCTAYKYAYDNGNGVISNSYSKLYNTFSFRVYNFGPYGGTNSYSGSTENLTDSLDGLNNWVANHGGEYSTWVKGEQYPYQSIFAATRNEIHTVTFDANGGSVDEATRMTANGEAIGNLPVPVNGDMKFEGWYHGLELVDETYPIYGDMTLRAKWKKEIKRQPTPEDPSFVVSDADHAIYQWYKISGNNQDIDLAKCSAGAYPWTLQDNGSFRSGNAGIGGSSSTAEKTVAVKAGARLTLDYTVSSEKDYDYFDITWNGTTLLSASGSKSGTFEHVFTSDATGTLKFLYSKDSSGNSGSDCVTVRNCAICEPDIRIEGETTSTLNLSRVDVGDRVYCEVTYDNDETSILRSDTITIVPGATNPNTLTFVESDETSSRTNTVSHKSDGTYEASSIIISDEYEWPYFGYSIACDNVSFSRQTSDDYITLVLPYMFDCDNAYVLTKTSDDSMTFTSVKGGIEPYTPVLVKTNGKDVNIIGHDIVSTTVAGFHLSPVEGVEGWYKAYVTSETTVEDVNADETLSKYDVYEISGNQFVRVTKRMTIKPFRTVYLCERQGVTSDIMRIILVEDGGTTFINRIENSGESEATYNTQGQRVSSSYRGIVLRNGKKNLSNQ